MGASTIRRWIAKGDLPALQPHHNGAVRIPTRALQARRKETTDGR